MRDYDYLNDYHLWSVQHKQSQGLIEEPIIALIDEFLYQALHEGASDIHIEPQRNQEGSLEDASEVVLLVRFRIDGTLYTHQIIPQEQKDLVISRLKVIAALDVAQQRVAQDGKYRLIFHPNDMMAGRPIDVRVATFPCVHGEKIVLRLLDHETGLRDFTSLGMSEQIALSLKNYLTATSSLLLVTGPTGSGKTTTLYSFLALLNNSEKNIVTMEDPIEYELSGINQSQVNEQSGFTFDVGLRSMLRQDPDYLMIGEIRDKKTVTIAIEAALTGHLVLSTLHTTNASLAITRLIDMGVEPFLISAAIGGVLAQRLVRKLCTACSKKQTLTQEQALLLTQLLTDFKEILTESSDDVLLSVPQELSIPVGCRECSGRGYKGRIGIFEWLPCDREIRALILQKASAQELSMRAQKKGSGSLLRDAYRKLVAGIIDYAEFLSIGIDE